MIYEYRNVKDEELYIQGFEFEEKQDNGIWKRYIVGKDEINRPEMIGKAIAGLLRTRRPAQDGSAVHKVGAMTKEALFNTLTNVKSVKDPQARSRAKRMVETAIRYYCDIVDRVPLSTDDIELYGFIKWSPQNNEEYQKLTDAGYVRFDRYRDLEKGIKSCQVIYHTMSRMVQVNCERIFTNQDGGVEVVDQTAFSGHVPNRFMFELLLKMTQLLIFKSEDNG